jgi:type IV pilus assembly protein PilC
MGLLPPMIVYLVRLGEETGTMDSLLDQAADYYDDESDTAIQAMTTILEPALIIVMAIIVVPILVAVLMPMFNMYDMMM